MKRKSIKNKITMTMISLIVLLSCAIGMVFCVFGYRISFDTLESTLTESAKIASQQVSNILTSYLNVVNEIGYSPILSNPKTTLLEK